MWGGGVRSDNVSNRRVALQMMVTLARVEPHHSSPAPRGELSPRTRKTWGFSSFPKCRFSRSLDRGFSVLWGGPSIENLAVPI